MSCSDHPENEDDIQRQRMMIISRYFNDKDIVNADIKKIILV